MHEISMSFAYFPFITSSHIFEFSLSSYACFDIVLYYTMPFPVPPQKINRQWIIFFQLYIHFYCFYTIQLCSYFGKEICGYIIFIFTPSQTVSYIFINVVTFFRFPKETSCYACILFIFYQRLNQQPTYLSLSYMSSVPTICVYL